MTLSHGSANMDELRTATYQRLNSPIFAPFMINVVCNLLNNSELMKYQSPLDIGGWIMGWGGGLKKLKQCYPQWDKQIYYACQAAPIGHKIWGKFLNGHNVPNIKSMNGIQILKTLLEVWNNTGQQHNTYGPYPTPFEQQEFQNVAIVPMGHIMQAIADLKFEPSFKANNLDIQTFIKQQHKQQRQQQQQLMNEDSKDEYKGNPQQIDFVQFKHLMDQEFKPLIDHIADGRDIIVPAPSDDDSRENHNEYFKYFNRSNGRKKFKHNLGTGIADLDEKYLKYIQGKLNQLEQYASNVQHINYPKMYGNQPQPCLNQFSNRNQHTLNHNMINYDSNEPWNWNFNVSETQNFGGHSANANRNNDEEKKEVMLNKENGGVIYYQSTYYTNEQIMNIQTHFMYSKEDAPKLLFDDNNVDKNRKLHEERLYFGGQAQDLGNYDRWFAYGITTTWKQQLMTEQSSYFQSTGQYSPQQIDFVRFKHLMDQEFKPLMDHIANGRDVIVPTPSDNDLREYRNKYFDRSNGRKKFKHNLGTGTADLNEKYLKYIQVKLDQLQQYASNVQEINHPKMYGNKPQPRMNPLSNRRRRTSPNSNQQQRRIHSQDPVTLTPRQQQRRNAQYRPSSNDLNLPYDDNLGWAHGNISPQRLVFDEKQTQQTESLLPRDRNETKQDPYGSIHYESPRHGPRVQQRRQSSHVEMKNETNGQQRQSESLLNTPRRNGNANNGFPTNRPIPHYKSPNRHVMKEEWQRLSTPENERRIVASSGAFEENWFGNGYKRVFNDDMLKNSINWCLFILFWFPRKIYITLMIQNRPQDVFKIISILLMVVGLVMCFMNGNSNVYWACFMGGIACALCGGDQFYPEKVRDTVSNWNKRNDGGQEWNTNKSYNGERARSADAYFKNDNNYNNNTFNFN